MAPLPPPCGFNFTFDPSLDEFNVSTKDYVAGHPQHSLIASGALVYAGKTAGDAASADANGATQSDKILLLQRAAHDSMPLRWEIPGGAVDDEDETILHGVAREVWEESGLLVRHVVRQVGMGQAFQNRKGNWIMKFNFEVEVEGDTEGVPKVTIDPEEHAAFLWVTEEETRQHLAAVGPTNDDTGPFALEITTVDQEKVILEGFRLKKGLESELQIVLGSTGWVEL